MSLICETCGKAALNKHDVSWNEEREINECGACDRKFEDDLEKYEERKRRRLSEENEY